MLRFFLAVLLIIPFSLFAQNVKMENGKVLVDNTVYARYEEVGQKKNTLPLTGELMEYNPEAMGSNFSDYIFSSPDGEQLVFATAKAMASAYRGRLVYYYNIQFGAMETELNIEYHLYAIENLAKDIAKYHIIKDGKLDEDAVATLAKAWNKKVGSMSGEQLSMSSRRTYNNSPYHLPSELDKSPVVVKDHKIYYRDSLIAIYHIAKSIASGVLAGTSKGEFYYYIEYPDGRPFGEMHLKSISSYIRIWAAPEKTPYRVYTAEREEENLIKVSVMSLLDHKQQMPISKQ